MSIRLNISFPVKVVTVNCARIIHGNQVATNGVVHVVDRVIQNVTDTIKDFLEKSEEFFSFTVREHSFIFPFFFFFLTKAFKSQEARELFLIHCDKMLHLTENSQFADCCICGKFDGQAWRRRSLYVVCSNG